MFDPCKGLGLESRKPNQLRQRQFPTGCGKAYDVALICKWMCALLQTLSQGEADSWMQQEAWFRRLRSGV